jgi:hypothetical protein
LNPRISHPDPANRNQQSTIVNPNNRQSSIVNPDNQQSPIFNQEIRSHQSAVRNQ